MIRRAPKSPNPFIGMWRIVEMELWDKDYVDLEGPGFIKFDKGGNGHFRFGAVQGDLDCRVENYAGTERIEFSWEGNNEADAAPKKFGCTSSHWAPRLNSGALEVARPRNHSHITVWLVSHSRGSLGQWRRPGSTGTKTRMTRTRRNTGCPSRWRSLLSLTQSASSRKTYPTVRANNGTTVSGRLVSESSRFASLTLRT